MPDLNIFYDSLFLQHKTRQHPECPERLTSTLEHLRATPGEATFHWRSCSPANVDRLISCHTPESSRKILDFCSQGGGYLDADTVVSPKSGESALAAVDAVCQAVDLAVTEQQRSFCLVRPPGHHARPASAMGFCLFNQVAVAAQWAIRQHQLERILIVDFDVHHGNGTQEIFWQDPRVAFFSAHRFPFYPGTGAADETGSGPGLGTTLNLPISFGTPRQEILSQFESRLEGFADRIRPQLILISAGFDAYRLDPIGSLGLEPEDFGVITTAIVQVAEQHCQGRVVSSLEGGYSLSGLPLCVSRHLEALALWR